MDDNCPEPGVYRDVPFGEYARWEAVSNSRLSRMAISPKHYITPTRYSSDALRLGNLCHTGRLEPTALAERYAVLPDYHRDDANRTDKGQTSNSKSTRYYKDKVAEFTAANANCELVSRGEYERMKAMVVSLDSDPLARELFGSVGPVEVSIVWDDPETGIRCKGRIDKLCDRGIADLKTTLELGKFKRSVAQYAYHRQQAFYRQGWAVVNDGELRDCYLVAAEKEPPHCVQSAKLSEVAIDQGDRDWRRLLDRVAECNESGYWPGPPAPDEWELPEWAVESVNLKIAGATA